MWKLEIVFKWQRLRAQSLRWRGILTKNAMTVTIMMRTTTVVVIMMMMMATMVAEKMMMVM